MVPLEKLFISPLLERNGLGSIAQNEERLHRLCNPSAHTGGSHRIYSFHRNIAFPSINSLGNGCVCRKVAQRFFFSSKNFLLIILSYLPLAFCKRYQVLLPIWCFYKRRQIVTWTLWVSTTTLGSMTLYIQLLGASALLETLIQK